MEKIEVSVVKQGGVDSLLKTKRSKKQMEKEKKEAATKAALTRKRSSFKDQMFLDERQIRSEFKE